MLGLFRPRRRLFNLEQILHNEVTRGGHKGSHDPKVMYVPKIVRLFGRHLKRGKHGDFLSYPASDASTSQLWDILAAQRKQPSSASGQLGIDFQGFDINTVFRCFLRLINHLNPPLLLPRGKKRGDVNRLVLGFRKQRQKATLGGGSAARQSQSMMSAGASTSYQRSQSAVGQSSLGGRKKKGRRGRGRRGRDAADAADSDEFGGGSGDVSPLTEYFASSTFAGSVAHLYTTHYVLKLLSFLAKAKPYVQLEASAATKRSTASILAHRLLHHGVVFGKSAISKAQHAQMLERILLELIQMGNGLGSIVPRLVDEEDVKEDMRSANAQLERLREKDARKSSRRGQGQGQGRGEGRDEGRDEGQGHGRRRRGRGESDGVAAATAAADDGASSRRGSRRGRSRRGGGDGSGSGETRTDPPAAAAGVGVGTESDENAGDIRRRSRSGRRRRGMRVMGDAAEPDDPAPPDADPASSAASASDAPTERKAETGPAAARPRIRRRRDASSSVDRPAVVEGVDQLRPDPEDLMVRDSLELSSDEDDMGADTGSFVRKMREASKSGRKPAAPRPPTPEKTPPGTLLTPVTPMSPVPPGDDAEMLSFANPGVRSRPRPGARARPRPGARVRATKADAEEEGQGPQQRQPRQASRSRSRENQKQRRRQSTAAAAAAPDAVADGGGEKGVRKTRRQTTLGRVGSGAVAGGGSGGGGAAAADLGGGGKGVRKTRRRQRSGESGEGSAGSEIGKPPRQKNPTRRRRLKLQPAPKGARTAAAAPTSSSAAAARGDGGDDEEAERKKILKSILGRESAQIRRAAIRAGEPEIDPEEEPVTPKQNLVRRLMKDVDAAGAAAATARDDPIPDAFVPIPLASADPSLVALGKAPDPPPGVAPMVSSEEMLDRAHKDGAPSTTPSARKQTTRRKKKVVRRMKRRPSPASPPSRKGGSISKDPASSGKTQTLIPTRTPRRKRDSGQRSARATAVAEPTDSRRRPEQPSASIPFPAPGGGAAFSGLDFVDSPTRPHVPDADDAEQPNPERVKAFAPSRSRPYMKPDDVVLGRSGSSSKDELLADARRVLEKEMSSSVRSEISEQLLSIRAKFDEDLRRNQEQTGVAQQSVVEEQQRQLGNLREELTGARAQLQTSEKRLAFVEKKNVDLERINISLQQRLVDLEAKFEAMESASQAQHRNVRMRLVEQQRQLKDSAVQLESLKLRLNYEDSFRDQLPQSRPRTQTRGFSYRPLTFDRKRTRGYVPGQYRYVPISSTPSEVSQRRVAQPSLLERFSDRRSDSTAPTRRPNSRSPPKKDYPAPSVTRAFLDQSTTRLGSLKTEIDDFLRGGLDGLQSRQ